MSLRTISGSCDRNYPSALRPTRFLGWWQYCHSSPAASLIRTHARQFRRYRPKHGRRRRNRQRKHPHSTLQVQGDLQGSVPGNDPVTQQPLSLTLAQAVKRGLQFNLSALVSNNAQRAANAERLGARAQTAARYKRGRARGRSNKLTCRVRPAFSLDFARSPASRASISPASSVRSITYDVRASVSQSVADLTRLHNYRSSKRAPALPG